MEPFSITMITLGTVILFTSCLGACTSVATFYRNYSQDASSNENTSNVEVDNTLIDERHPDGAQRQEKRQKIKIDNYNAGQNFSITKEIKTGEDNKVANQLAGVAATATGIIPGVGNPIMGFVGPSIAAANAVTDNASKAKEIFKKDKGKNQTEDKNKSTKAKQKATTEDVFVTDLSDEESVEKQSVKRTKNTKNEKVAIIVDGEDTQDFPEIKLTGDNESSTENS